MYNGNPIGLELPKFVEAGSYVLPNPECAATHRAAPSPSQPRSKPASRSAFRSSSKKAKRSKCRPRTARSPGGHNRERNLQREHEQTLDDRVIAWRHSSRARMRVAFSLPAAQACRELLHRFVAGHRPRPRLTSVIGWRAERSEFAMSNVLT